MLFATLDTSGRPSSGIRQHGSWGDGEQYSLAMAKEGAGLCSEFLLSRLSIEKQVTYPTISYPNLVLSWTWFDWEDCNLVLGKKTVDTFSMN